MPYDEYIKTNILNPLGMTRSTTKQPPPAELASDLALPYNYVNGAYQEQPFIFINGAQPSGSMSTTSTDIAKFMIAHLENGVYNGSRILQDATIQQMHQQLFSNDPKTCGIAHGFLELKLNGINLLFHDGAVPNEYYSILVLFPEQHLGFFVSFNSQAASSAPYVVLRLFLNEYFPVTSEPAPSPPSDFSQRAAQFIGVYRNTRMSYSTYLKASTSFKDQKAISSLSNGTLLIGNGVWVETAPLTFNFLGEPLENVMNNTIVFRENEQGQVTYYFESNTPSVAYERVPWYETTFFTFTTMYVFIALFTSMLIFLPTRYLYNRRRGKEKTATSKWAKWALLSAGAFSVLFIIFAVGFIFGISKIDAFVSSVPIYAVAVLSTGLVASAFTIMSFAFTVLAWKKHYWTLPTRIYYTIVTVASIAFILIMNNLNLIGFRF